MVATYVPWGIAIVIFLLFMLLASREIVLLFSSPVRGMGPGIYRIWAVARTTLLEAWNHRVWLVVPLQILVSIILILTIRPFDETERIPLYLRVLITSQEIILLVVFWVMACISLPNERFFKIVVTNVSKPLSRLEILIGKMLGFTCAALGLLVIMGITSYVTLRIADNHIRKVAQIEYASALNDFHMKNAKMQVAVEPPESLKLLAEQGSLFAYNYISVPKDSMTIAGDVIKTPNGFERYLKGGSSEQIIYRFSPSLVGAENADQAGPGQRPFFAFYYPFVPLDPNHVPTQIVLNVTATRARQGLQEQSKTIILDARKGVPRALWEPENPLEIFSFPGLRDNGEIEVTVRCQTEGVLLRVLDGVPADKLTEENVVNDFNILSFPGRGVRNVEVPLPNPVIRGFERHDKQQIAGPSKKEAAQYGANAPLEAAIYRFPAASLSNVPVEKGNFKLSMLLDVDKESNQDAETMAWIRVYNQNNPSDFYDQSDIPVIEKRETTVDIPAKYLGGNNPSKRGDFVVELHCQTSGHWLALLDDSVRIQKPPEPFVLNLAKSELVLLCEVSLLIVICVTWSVLLGWPVAMLTSFVCWAFGFFRAAIHDYQSIGGLGALGFPNFGQQSASYHFFNNVFAGLWAFLGFLSDLMPDFSRYDALEYITQLRNMPASVLLINICWTLIYILPFIALGYLFFRKQELG